MVEIRMLIAEFKMLDLPAICARSGKRASTSIKTVFSPRLIRAFSSEAAGEDQPQNSRSRSVRLPIPATWSRKLARILFSAAGLVGLMVGPPTAIVGLVDDNPYVVAWGLTIAICGVASLVAAARVWISGWLEGNELVIARASERFAQEVHAAKHALVARDRHEPTSQEAQPSARFAPGGRPRGVELLGMITPPPGDLTPEQRRVWKRYAITLLVGVVLAGGTAVTLTLLGFSNNTAVNAASGVAMATGLVIVFGVMKVQQGSEEARRRRRAMSRKQRVRQWVLALVVVVMADLVFWKWFDDLFIAGVFTIVVLGSIAWGIVDTWRARKE